MIYVLGAGPDFVKIGVAKNLQSRIQILQTGNPFPLIPLRKITTKSQNFDYTFERALHDRYANAKSPAKNEWFYKGAISDLLSANTGDMQCIAYQEGLKGNYILKVEGYGDEIRTCLREYLDSKTLIALDRNCVCTFEDLDRFLAGGFLAPGIGNTRYELIKRAYQMWKEDHDISS